MWSESRFSFQNRGGGGGGGGAIFRTRRKSNGMKIGALAWSSLHHSIDTISIYDHSLSMPAPGHEAFHEGRMEKQTGLLLLSKVSLTSKFLLCP